MPSLLNLKPILVGSSALLLLTASAAPVGAFEIVDPGETQVFTAADDCDGTPFLDSLLKGTDSRCVDPSRVEAGAMLSISAINNDVTAFGTLFTDFLVSGDNESVLDATVSATVDWDGLLFGAGVLGAGASVKLELLLVDDTAGAIKARTVIVNQKQDSTGLKGIDVGGTRFAGSDDVSLQGTVVRGHMHSIQLRLTCSAETGLVGVDVGCIYFNNFFGLQNDPPGDQHAKWTSLSITVEQDIFDRLDQIDAKLLEIEGKIDALDDRMDLIDLKLDEVLRLLLIPQGRRSTDLLDCEGEACRFPLTRGGKRSLR